MRLAGLLRQHRKFDCALAAWCEPHLDLRRRTQRERCPAGKSITSARTPSPWAAETTSATTHRMSPSATGQGQACHGRGSPSRAARGQVAVEMGRDVARRQDS